MGPALDQTPLRDAVKTEQIDFGIAEGAGWKSSHMHSGRMFQSHSRHFRAVFRLLSMIRTIGRPHPPRPARAPAHAPTPQSTSRRKQVSITDRTSITRSSRACSASQPLIQAAAEDIALDVTRTQLHTTAALATTTQLPSRGGASYRTRCQCESISGHHIFYVA